MGISRQDLREYLIDEWGAVGTYIQDARESAVTLMI
jgi:peroxiredoxin family protein